MKDEHETLRKAWIKRLSEYVDTPAERRQKAIEALGERYLLHPSNRVQRRATPYGSIR